MLNPTREAALDRWAGHTAFVPNSMGAYKAACNQPCTEIADLSDCDSVAGLQSVLNPTREAALDRWAGHTAFVPNSMNAYKAACNLARTETATHFYCDHAAGLQSVLNPTREAALDRWAGHTAFVPNSMKAYKAACNLRNLFAGAVAVELATVLVQTHTSGVPPLDSLAKYAPIEGCD